ncbi:hypothetical protein FQA39_LY19423 [Lamprigera yunnana]|nr:hypothetical protein FQA39_LY19423 [Lamprigera yunnana]
MASGTGFPVRVHGAFVSDDEVHRVVSYLKEQGEPDYIEGVLEGSSEEGDSGFGDEGGGTGEKDPMYDQAVEIVLKDRKASISAPTVALSALQAFQSRHLISIALAAASARKDSPMKQWIAAATLVAISGWAQADGLQSLEQFIQNAQAWRSQLYANRHLRRQRRPARAYKTVERAALPLQRPAQVSKFLTKKPFEQSHSFATRSNLTLFDCAVPEPGHQRPKASPGPEPAALLASTASLQALRAEFTLSNAPDARRPAMGAGRTQGHRRAVEERQNRLQRRATEHAGDRRRLWPALRRALHRPENRAVTACGNLPVHDSIGCGSGSAVSR